MRFDARELTPLLVSRMVIAAAQTRSFGKAEIVMADVAGQPVSAKTVERVVQDVGQELAQRRDASPKCGDSLARTPEEPPDLAVVECDGGRLQTREPEQGPGVHLSGKGWNETKNACLIRAQRQSFTEDPQPEPPECFCDPKHVAKIADTEALSVASPKLREVCVGEDDNEPAPTPSAGDWRPKRLVRTVLSSMANSDEFGRQMSRKAQSRRFFEAEAKAFLGDGLPWHWSIWKRHFSQFTPILDFIHVLSYLFLAAKAVHTPAGEDRFAQDFARVAIGGVRRRFAQAALPTRQLFQNLVNLALPAATHPHQILLPGVGARDKRDVGLAAAKPRKLTRSASEDFRRER